MSEPYFSLDGKNELEIQGQKLLDQLKDHSKFISDKEGHYTVNEIDVQHAANDFRIINNSEIKYIIWVIGLITIGMAFLQIGFLVSLSLSNQILFLIFPITMILISLFIGWKLRDWL